LEAYELGSNPLRAFIASANQSERLETFVQIGASEGQFQDSRQECANEIIDNQAFVTSELKTAFQIALCYSFLFSF